MGRISLAVATLVLSVGVAPAANAQYAGVNGRILFSAPSGIMTVRPDSTNLHSLGTVVAECKRPMVYSPSGASIAYQALPSGRSDSDIYLQNSTFAATPVQLTNDVSTNDCDPYYSPDGTRVAFTRVTIAGGHREVWVVNVDGTGLTQLTSNLGGSNNSSYAPVWLDANTIYVGNFDFANSGYKIIMGIDSTTANQTTGTTIYAPALTDQEADIFDINPAGSQIVFSNYFTGIYTCTLTTTCSSATQIIALGAASITRPEHPAYSPDGTKIVFVGSIPNAPITEDEGIYIANTDGTGIARMTFNAGGFRTSAYSTHQPYWGTNNDTFGGGSGGDGGSVDGGSIIAGEGGAATPGVPNTTATSVQKNSPVPWMLGGLLTLMLLGLGGIWIVKESKTKK